MSILVTVPTSRLAENLGTLPEGVDLQIWDLASPPPAQRIDLVVPPYMGGTRALRSLEGLDIGLVQGQSIGYDGVAEHLPAGVTFANAASVHETSTAELAVGLMLAAQRQLPRFVTAQQRGEWDPVFAASLADRHVLNPAELAGERWVATFEATICRQWLRRLFDGVPNAPRIVHESMEFANHLELARAGLAVALVPRLGRGPLGPDLVAIPTADPASTRDVHAVHRRTQADSPALRAALDAAVAHASRFVG